MVYKEYNLQTGVYKVQTFGTLQNGKRFALIFASKKIKKPEIEQ